jgi:pectinesterase
MLAIRFWSCCCLVLVACIQTVWAAGSDGLRYMHDLEYGRAGGYSLRLDAVLPGGDTVRPGVVLVHGGGWSSGNKTEMQFLAERLGRAGFACFSVNYRLAPEFRWPACLEDVRTALGWVRRHAADYGVDSQRIVLLGYSAGGHLACQAAVTADKDEKPAAVVLLAAPIDHEADSERRGGLSPSMQKLLDRGATIDDKSRAVLRSISPIHFVNADCPPVVLVHGTDDTSVPYDQSVRLMAKLQEHNVRCELVTLKGAGHRIAEWERYDAAYQDKLIDLLKQTLDSKRSRRMIRVSPDGAGDFTSVQSAIDSIADGNTEEVLIRIAPGVYKERIVVPKSKPNIRFKGENAEITVLTYHLSARMLGPDGQEIGTFKTPSVTIEADDFVAENVTFENSAGDVGQALAIAVFGDRVVFRKCRFLGWQDTILDHAGRHYYEDCYIAGHCDFIFGSGVAYFERCHIHCLEGSYITAASTPEHEPYGYVFANCKITGEPAKPKTYLGRPWRDFANVIFLNTHMEGVIRPEGWHNWSKPEREKTARYAEYNSTGPGANPDARVPWSRQLTAEEAEKITPQEVLKGTDGWNPFLK